VENLALGYYLAHGLARLLTRRHWLAERKFAWDYLDDRFGPGNWRLQVLETESGISLMSYERKFLL